MPDPNLDQLNYHVPEVSTMYDAPLLRKKRAIGTRAGQRSFLRLPLLDGQGTAIDLTQYNIHNGCGAPYLQYALNNGIGNLPNMAGQPRVMTRYSEASGAVQTLVQVTAEVLNASEGLVMCEIPAQVSSIAGIYLAELAILDQTDVPIYSNECYVYNEASAWGQGRGIPALDEIRISLRDSDPAENELIANYDFGLPELCYAVVRTVRAWNSMPPFIYAASTIAFPNSEIMMLGTQLHLFELAEEHYRRNKLTYAAGQTQLDDKDKEANYNKAFSERYQRFRQLVMHHKAAMNMNRGFASHTVNYGGVR